jgi:cell division protein ZipA
MPQLRWTLLLLGVLFVILLWWLERRTQRQKFRDRGGPVEKEPTAEPPPASAPMFREPSLTLPEMRAREPSAPHELPVVEIEDDSAIARALAPGAPLMDPPTLSLPVLESGPVRRERVEPAVSGTEWIKPRLKEFDVPRLDTPALKRPVNRVDLADTTDPEMHDTAEQAFNEAVFGNSDLDLGEESTSPDLSAEAPRAGRTASPEPAPRAASETAWRASPEMVRPEAVRALAPEPVPRASPDAVRRVAPEAEWNARPAASPAAPEATRTPPSDTARSIAPDAWPVEASAPSADPAVPEAAEPEESPVPRFTAADVTPIVEPIVDWPPDDQRRVVAIRLVSPPPDRLPGRALRLALASEGFVLGKFQIFHKPDATGRAVLSAANLSKPGTFDPGTMDVQRFGGLSLFTVLPGPKPPLKAFDDLLATARNLNERLQGALQDERGGPLTPTRIASLRESLGSMEAAS